VLLLQLLLSLHVQQRITGHCNLLQCLVLLPLLLLWYAQRQRLLLLFRLTTLM
jgi:hypothetical protein